MDGKTRDLDRVLEALSPALASELDRVARETREVLQLEYEARLEAAVREADNATASVQAERDRAREQAKEEIRHQVTAELEQQFSERLEAATAQLRKEAAEEQAQLRARVDQWRNYAEAQRQLAEASSQSEMLARFLQLTQPFADGLALYIAKPAGLGLWKSSGTGAFPDIISKEMADRESYFRTISVRGNIVGAVCAVPSFKADALDFLTASLERAIEAFGLKLRAPVPTAAAS